MVGVGSNDRTVWRLSTEASIHPETGLTIPVSDFNKADVQLKMAALHGHVVATIASSVGIIFVHIGRVSLVPFSRRR